MIATYAALSFLDGLLLWLLIGARGRWFVKMLVTVLVLGFNTVVLYNSSDGSGWPTRNDIPNGASFLACAVNEPTPTDKGTIDFWVTLPKQQKSMFGYSSGPGTPKAFQVPYTRQLHIMCLEAQQARKLGHPVGITKNKGRKQQGQPGNHTPGRYHLYHFPTPQLPKKGQ